MNNKCYTIGHSNYHKDKFLDFINTKNIDCIVDIRSTPFSKYNPAFNKPDIQNLLDQNNIGYIFMGDLLGARYTNSSFLFPDGRVDFSKVKESEQFQLGINRVISGINKGYNIALLCSEKDPFNCHRSILVARTLKEKGINIDHILESGDIISQSSIESRILFDYQNKHSQASLSGNTLNTMDLLNAAYIEKNKEIAYKPSI